MIAELGGVAGEHIRAINLKYDPRLAKYKAPHVTITGSSGVGPLPASVTVAEMVDKLGPIVASTPPLLLEFGAPIRFMQSEIIVMPLDPHGPLRIFHDRVANSGLPFQQARFTFTPHCTLSLYPTLTREAERELLAVRIKEPVLIDTVTLYHTLDPQPSKKLIELRLSGVE
ncbi:MAG: 2'-5' RNA ligase family protein [Candidatus Binatia bacterium]